MNQASNTQIEVVPYSESWPALFAEEASLLRRVLGQWLVAEIEHIGSTAVPGLSAKSVIDIMAPVLSLPASIGAIAAAESVGYCYFPYKPQELHWFCKPSPTLRTHHLHVVPYNSTVWRERLAFRDALRASASLAKRYQQLKLELAARHPLDREAYTQAKAHFIQEAIASSSAA